jgi:endonuclease YncB( thermonuclease family)
MVSMTARLLLFVILLCAALGFAGPCVHAQEADPAAPRYFEADARAVDAGTLLAGKTTIALWGVRAVEGMDAPFMLSARTALDNAVGPRKVRCELKTRDERAVFAQCTNAEGLDLGLFMLQQGFVAADRGTVYGTVYETPYIQAETQAEGQGLGVWSVPGRGGEGGGSDLVVVLGFVLFLCVVGTFVVLSVLMMKGFQKVVDAQQQNMDMMSRERALRDKEREIFATMLDSEIKSNKSKIEAYLVVYDEMLKALKDETRPPKYKKAGDIVQSQPALDRSVFDRNTDKLDILGDRLSSEVIHFYARIKTSPDYINLEPHMAPDEARSIVEKSLSNAERLNKIAGRLIELFAKGGHASGGEPQ